VSRALETVSRALETVSRALPVTVVRGKEDATADEECCCRCR
jgi:hypothetical protein